MRLGRLVPPDWEHVEKYPLTLATTPSRATPGVFGINWYSSFDRPVRDGSKWWIGLGNLGFVRGGHAIASLPTHVSDLTGWWDFYNQGDTGECEGFSHARIMSWVNRARYDAEDLYCRALKLDGQSYCDKQAGSYNRVLLEVLRTQGPKTPKGKQPSKEQGIAAYRWATTADGVLSALEQAGADQPYSALGAVPLTNSWGRDYPHVVWIPLEVVDRLLGEDGEFGTITDR